MWRLGPRGSQMERDARSALWCGSWLPPAFRARPMAISAKLTKVQTCLLSANTRQTRTWDRSTNEKAAIDWIGCTATRRRRRAGRAIRRRNERLPTWRLHSRGEAVPGECNTGGCTTRLALAEMYSRGLGVRQSYVELIKWYRLAAARGYSLAQTALGFYYAAGHGVPQDFIRAHMWFDIATASGEPLGPQNRDSIAKVMTPTTNRRGAKNGADVPAA